MSFAAGIDGRRRRYLGSAAVAAGLALAGARARAHGAVGPVRPARPAPDLALTDHQGRRRTLAQLLGGKRSALQLIFTGCSAICPLQGAVFAQVQDALSRHPLDGAQLLSLSIDPLGDTPAALRAWRARFAAGEHWLAAVPALADLDRLQRAFTDVPSDGLDRHTAQVFFFDAHAMMAWRSTELPSALEIEQVLRQLS